MLSPNLESSNADQISIVGRWVSFGRKNCPLQKCTLRNLIFSHSLIIFEHSYVTHKNPRPLRGYPLSQGRVRSMSAFFRAKTSTESTCPRPKFLPDSESTVFICTQTSIFDRLKHRILPAWRDREITVERHLEIPSLFPPR